MAEYPEHEKLALVKYKSQCVGDFIEWLGEEGFFICALENRYPDMPFSGRFSPIPFSRNKLLADFFHIDESKLESEKRQMLDEIRMVNDASRNS